MNNDNNLVLYKVDGLDLWVGVVGNEHLTVLNILRWLF